MSRIHFSILSGITLLYHQSVVPGANAFKGNRDTSLLFYYIKIEGEFVETEEVLEMVKASGIDLAQGDYIGRPKPGITESLG